jgi:hypothetical protein
MLLLLAIANLAATAPESQPKLQAQATARATVRIVTPVKIDKTIWERLPKSARREVIVRDERGQPVLLRLIENQ